MLINYFDRSKKVVISSVEFFSVVTYFSWIFLCISISIFSSVFINLPYLTCFVKPLKVMRKFIKLFYIGSSMFSLEIEISLVLIVDAIISKSGAHFHTFFLTFLVYHLFIQFSTQKLKKTPMYRNGFRSDSCC